MDEQIEYKEPQDELTRVVMAGLEGNIPVTGDRNPEELLVESRRLRNLGDAAERRRRFIAHAQTKGMQKGTRLLWQKICDKQIDDEFMERFNDGDSGHAVAEWLEEYNIICRAGEAKLLWDMKKGDWLYKIATIEAMDRRMQTMDGAINEDTITRKVVDEALMSDSVLSNMSAADLIKMKQLHIQMETLEIRKIEALRQVYQWQYKTADVVVEFLKDSVRAEELRTMAKQKGLSGEEFVEAVRHRVYGKDAVQRPAGFSGGIGERVVKAVEMEPESE